METSYVQDQQRILRHTIKDVLSADKFREFLSEMIRSENPAQLQNIFNSNPLSMLTSAMKYERRELVQPLLNAKADPNFMDETRVPVLNRAIDNRYWNHCFSDEGRYDAAKCLIESKADPNSISKHGESPLLLAVPFTKLVFIFDDALLQQMIKK
jgi:ankyrin repeat protein